MKQFSIFVFANLKESQIHYKIVPLSMSDAVRRVIILRKEYIALKNDKVICYSIPKYFCKRPWYWMFVPLYGTFLVIRHKIDIILNYNIFPHGFNGFFASLITSKKLIFSEINEDTMKYHGSPILHFIVNSIIKRATIVNVTGTRNRLFWESRGVKMISNIHSTIDTNTFTICNQPKIYDFIFVGEFDQNKRPDRIIEAFHSVYQNNRDIKLCMIGFGVLEDQLKNYVIMNNLSQNVIILQTKNVRKYYQSAKIFVMASLSEGLPCAMMEAMSCGLIPIVTPVGDIADVISVGSNGFFHDGSINDLSQKMNEVLTRYDQFDELMLNARRTIVNEHSYAVAKVKWDNLLQELENENTF